MPGPPLALWLLLQNFLLWFCWHPGLPLLPGPQGNASRLLAYLFTLPCWLGVMCLVKERGQRWIKPLLLLQATAILVWCLVYPAYWGNWSFFHCVATLLYCSLTRPWPWLRQWAAAYCLSASALALLQGGSLVHTLVLLAAGLYALAKAPWCLPLALVGGVLVQAVGGVAWLPQQGALLHVLGVAYLGLEQPGYNSRAHLLGGLVSWLLVLSTPHLRIWLPTHLRPLPPINVELLVRTAMGDELHIRCRRSAVINQVSARLFRLGSVRADYPEVRGQLRMQGALALDCGRLLNASDSTLAWPEYHLIWARELLRQHPDWHVECRVVRP